MPVPNGGCDTCRPHRPVDIILELIDNALADYELELLQLRTAIDNGPVLR